jgi:NADH dehydrogenase
MVWLFVHLMQLIGFRNRLVVLVDWAWQYLFYRPASALILDDGEPGERGRLPSTLPYKELDKLHPPP